MCGAILKDPVVFGTGAGSPEQPSSDDPSSAGRRHRSLVQGLGEVDVECRECSDSDERKLCCECKKNVQ